MNLGPGINSPAQEIRGSVSRDGLTYFFASDRSGENGGAEFDIYVATRETTSERFDNVTALGPPIGGSTLEVCPTISPNWPAAGSKLYFASWTGSEGSEDRPVREGEGNFDIFEATWSVP